MSSPPPLLQDVTGLVLAGGQGQRMGGVDKGLQCFQGLPLARHSLQRLQAQVGTVLLNANRNLDRYAILGVPVWPDPLPGQAGPLAGFACGLQHARTPWLLTVPCDSPRFPPDLAWRLYQAAIRESADIAMAWAPEPPQGDTRLRAQPVFCLLHTRLRDSLDRFLAAGGRKIDAWTAQHRCVPVAFDQPHDDPLAFANTNTLAELHWLETQAPRPHP